MYRKTVSLTLPSGQKLPVQVAVVRHNGEWCAAASFKVRGEPVKLTATASEALVKSALEKMGAIALDSPETGGFFDDIARKVAKFARSKVLGQVLQGVASVAKNPLFQKLATFYPPLQTAMKYVGKGAEAAAAAQSLIQRAKTGDTKARTSIAKINQAAKAGNKNAALMHNVLYAVNRAAMSVAPKPTNVPGFDFSRFNFADLPPISAGAAVGETMDPDFENLLRTVRSTNA